MTPERLRGWLKKIPAGTKGVQLAVEVEGAGLVPIGNWEREEAKGLQGQPTDRDLAAALIEQAQEYTDAEQRGQKFVIRWMGSKDAALKSTTHRVQPTATEEDDASGGVDDTTERVLALLLKAHADKDKQIQSAFQTATDAYGKVIQMLTAQLTESYNSLAEEKKRDAVAVPAVVELTPEQKEESFQRTEAMKVFTAKLPDVLDLLVTVGAHKLLPESDKKTPHVAAVPDMEE